MKKFFIIPFLLLACIQVLAVPAKNKKIEVKTEDGYIYIHLKGDEFCKYGMTDEGYTVIADGENWFYACKDSSGNVICSEYRLMNKHSDELKQFLSKTPKGLVPIKNQKEICKRTNSPVTDTRVGNRSIINSPVIGERRILVILMQFPDKKFIKSPQEFDELFNKKEYKKDGATGSIYDYYKTASYGLLEMHCDIIGAFTAKNNMAYYGANSGVGGHDVNPKELFDEAIENARDIVKLSDYDYNNDGYIDNIHIIYAGYGEESGASANTIWAHQMRFNPMSVNDMLIDRYSCSPELRNNNGNGITRIGVICHEIGHSLGALDYYDVDYQVNGEYEGTGEWDIMASGSWNNNGASPADFNPYVKIYNFGWANAQQLSSENTNIIKPSYVKNEIYRIDTQNPGEFFLLENRQKTETCPDLPGEGLLIFHIDKSITEKEKNNSINATYPQACYPVCASSPYQYPTSQSGTYGKINSAGCPYPGSSTNRTFNSSSTPAALTTNKKETDINISNIVLKDDGYVYLDYSNNDNTDDSIWEESFESTNINDYWQAEDITGTSQWYIKKSLTTSQSNPTAIDGNGVLVFESTNSNTLKRERTCGTLKSQRINIAKDKAYTIKLYCYKECIYKDALDTISIYIRNIDNNWTLLKDTMIEKSEEWMVINQSFTATEDIEIMLMCNIDKGTRVYIDAISIYNTEEENTTGIHDKETVIIKKISNRIYIYNNSLENETISIYKPDGSSPLQKTILKGEEYSLSLQPGIYIIVNKHTHKKIFVGSR